MIPPQANAACVWALEDGLEGDTRPDDPQRPQVGVDETSTQRVAETRLPLPAAPGQPERVDDEDAPQGTAKLFLVFEPLAGQRRVKVTQRRTAVEGAQRLREVVETQYAPAETIVLVMDNLNTHTLASLSAAFDPAEARRVLERLAMPATPKHGRWLTRAETALSVLATQGLNRRLPDSTLLSQVVAAWQAQRHAAHGRVDWRFTTQDASLKLTRRYPSIQLG